MEPRSEERRESTDPRAGIGPKHAGIGPKVRNTLVSSATRWYRSEGPKHAGIGPEHAGIGPKVRNTAK
jgi:hypothetical protein